MNIQYIEVRIEPWSYAKPFGTEKQLRIKVKAHGLLEENFTEVLTESDTIDNFSLMMKYATRIIKERIINVL